MRSAPSIHIGCLAGRVSVLECACIAGLLDLPLNTAEARPGPHRSDRMGLCSRQQVFEPLSRQSTGCLGTVVCRHAPSL